MGKSKLTAVCYSNVQLYINCLSCIRYSGQFPIVRRELNVADVEDGLTCALCGHVSDDDYATLFADVHIT